MLYLIPSIVEKVTLVFMSKYVLLVLLTAELSLTRSVAVYLFVGIKFLRARHLGA